MWTGCLFSLSTDYFHYFLEQFECYSKVKVRTRTRSYLPTVVLVATCDIILICGSGDHGMKRITDGEDDIIFYIHALSRTAVCKLLRNIACIFTVCDALITRRPKS